MIANFFNKTKPVVFFVIAVLLLIYLLAATFLFHFNGFSLLFLGKTAGVFGLLIAFLLVVNFIIQKNQLTYNNSYTLLLIVLLFGTFYETMFSYKILFANLILLFGFRKIYSLRSKTRTKQKLFDAGFWIGVASLIYVWSIFYVLLIYLAIVIYEKLDVKNIFVPIIGMVTPIFIYFTYCFYFDNTALFLSNWMLDPNLNFVDYNQFKLLIPITFLLALVLWSVVYLTPSFANRGINAKRLWRVSLNHLIISAFIIMFSPVKNGSEMFFGFFPMSIIVANFLRNSESNNFKNLILYLLVLISISVYFL